MKKIICLFVLSLIVIVSFTSCQSDSETNQSKELLSGKYEKNINTDEFYSLVSINLNGDYTCSYSQEIVVDNDKINHTLSGEWKFNEDNNTLTLILIDAEDNTRHEEVGVVNLTNKTITFGDNEFKR